MSFFALTCLGIAAGIVHLFVPSRHVVGPASAIALGVVGAWNGALLASALVRGGWAAVDLGLRGLAGGLVGAVGTIAAFEAMAELYLSRARAREG